MRSNFVIVGTQRTGSSAIAQSIGLHPRISCGWEWSLHASWRNKIKVPEAALAGDFSGLRHLERDHIASSLKPGAKWLGYRSLFRSSDKWLFRPSWSPALWMDRLNAHLEWFASRPEIHIVHIVREDNIAWLRSKYMSRATNTYTSTTYPEDLRVRISEREALRRIMAKNWVDARLGSLSGSNPYVRLSYENFDASGATEIARVFSLLGCEPLAPNESTLSLRRQSTQPAEVQIVNYDQLVSLLGGMGLLRSSP